MSPGPSSSESRRAPKPRALSQTNTLANCSKDLACEASNGTLVRARLARLPLRFLAGAFLAAVLVTLTVSSLSTIIFAVCMIAILLLITDSSFSRCLKNSLISSGTVSSLDRAYGNAAFSAPCWAVVFVQIFEQRQLLCTGLVQNCHYVSLQSVDQAHFGPEIR